MESFTLVVADDDVDLRAALCEVLSATPGFDVVAAVGTGHEAAEAAERWRPQIALLDVRMPGGGIDAIRAVRRRAPDTAVVAISAHAGAVAVADVLRAGAVGFLAKGWGDLALPDVLRRCARGEVVVATPSGAAALSLLVEGEFVLS